MSYKEKIRRALSYPYAQEESSYMLSRSQVSEIPVNCSLENRVPVIACGSNASAQQLIRKFSNLPEEPIYVTRARLPDFVSCYSAHITAYGSIPATLANIPGSVSECHITWLNQNQLEHMHTTEAIGINYRFSLLENIDLACEYRGQVSNAYAYISLHGNLVSGDTPILVSEIGSIAPVTVASLTQTAIQNRIHQELAPDSSFDDFIVSNISQQEVRSDRSKLMRQDAHQFTYPHERIILT